MTIKMGNYCFYILLCFVIPAGCFNFRKTPASPLVVYYSNRTNVEFRWEWTLGSGEVIPLFKIKRYRKNFANTESVLATYYSSGNDNVDTTKYNLTVSNTVNGSASFVIKDLTNQGNINVMSENEVYVYKIVVDEQTQAKEYSNEAELNVLRIPYITTYPQNQTASGGTVTFQCAAGGKPPPTITWTKIGSSETFSTGSPLTLSNFDVSKVGVYKCMARSTGIVENASAIAFVQFSTCGSGCTKEELGIEFTDLVYSNEYENHQSTTFKELKNKIEFECLTAYALKGKAIHKCEVLRYRRGSVVAALELGWPDNAVNPKQPLLEAISNGSFAGYRVNNEFVNAVDLCVPFPCGIHGKNCTNGVNNFTCSCLPGWSGKRCGSDTIDSCVSIPCKNNGTCTDLANGYRCSCAQGWFGQNCSTNINVFDQCASNPCKNGGTCTDLAMDFSCSCTSGWEGKDCSRKINPCVGSPCRNGGTCYYSPHDEFICKCHHGFTGKLCEEEGSPNEAVAVRSAKNYIIVCITVGTPMVLRMLIF